MPKLAAAILTLVCGVASPQSAEPHSAFTAIDIHTSPASATMPFMRGGELHGTHYELRNATMVDLISTAYGVDRDKVFGGPSWLEYDHYDIFALAPPKTSPEALKLMLQSLLAGRFHLVAKPETKPLPAYSLKVGKQLKLKESDGTGEPGCKTDMKANAEGAPSDGAAGGRVVSILLTMNCRNTSIAGLLDEVPIPRPAGQPNRPVIDQTGLKGTWNFEFEITLGAGALQIAAVSDALDKQLGLKLQEITMPLPVVEVENVNRQSDPNSPEDLKAFPPLPTEFDVGEIKPATNSDAVGGRGMEGGRIVVAGRGGIIGGQIQNGRINLTNVTLQNLIGQVWGLPNTDSLVGGPKWLNSDRWDVIAKVPPGFTDAFTDFDSIRQMLRNLLTEKFKLQVHTEEQPQTGYVLTAVKPKMKKADPNGRTRWINGVPEGEKDPRPGNPPVGRVVTCQNMSMDQFAELLPRIAGGYFQGSTVVNRTGLEGQFDFTIYFLVAGQAGRGGRGGVVMVGGGVFGGGASDNSAADPTGGLSLFDAVTKLLGLKIDTEKRPTPVLVIDHIEQKPIN